MVRLQLMVILASTTPLLRVAPILALVLDLIVGLLLAVVLGPNRRSSLGLEPVLALVILPCLTALTLSRLLAAVIPRTDLLELVIPVPGLLVLVVAAPGLKSPAPGLRELIIPVPRLLLRRGRHIMAPGLMSPAQSLTGQLSPAPGLLLLAAMPHVKPVIRGLQARVSGLSTRALGLVAPALWLIDLISGLTATVRPGFGAAAAGLGVPALVPTRFADVSAPHRGAGAAAITIAVAAGPPTNRCRSVPNLKP